MKYEVSEAKLRKLLFRLYIDGKNDMSEDLAKHIIEEEIEKIIGDNNI